VPPQECSVAYVKPLPQPAAPGSLSESRRNCSGIDRFQPIDSFQTRRERWRLRQRRVSRRDFPSACFRARSSRGGGWTRPWQTAIRCGAQLSWRLPPRSRRWRVRFPEEAGTGATAARRANLASEPNLFASAVSAIGLAAVSAPPALRLQQPRGLLFDQRRDLGFQLHRLAEIGPSIFGGGAGGGLRRRISDTSSRATLRRVPCSARASLRARSSSQTGRPRAPVGISSSGQRSCRCQRRENQPAGPNVAADRSSA
jgi:hypothetical protein